MIGPTLGAWVHDLDPVAIHFPASWGLRGEEAGRVRETVPMDAA